MSESSSTAPSKAKKEKEELKHKPPSPASEENVDKVVVSEVVAEPHVEPVPENVPVFFNSGDPEEDTRRLIISLHERCQKTFIDCQKGVNLILNEINRLRVAEEKALTVYQKQKNRMAKIAKKNTHYR
jgi:hypothetical protein